MKNLKLMAQTLVVISGLLLTTASFAQQQQKRNVRPYSNQSNDKVNYLYAGAYKNEVEASGTYGQLSSANSTSAFQATVVYKYLIAKSMQVGTIVNLAYLSGNGNSNTYMGLWGSFTYNFNDSWNISDSWFAEGAVGIVDTAYASGSPSGNSDKKFSYMFMGGKRIPIFDKISYIPKAGVRKIGDTDMAILIIPLNIGIAF